jgi:hypothetical protein
MGTNTPKCTMCANGEKIENNQCSAGGTSIPNCRYV